MSKKIDIKIKLKKAMLAARHGKGDVRRFDLNPGSSNKVRWEINQVQWRWAMSEALDSMNLLRETSVDYIRIPVDIECPGIGLYTRRWTDKAGSHKEDFEAFRAGTTITIPVTILSELEGKSDSPFDNLLSLRPPTEEEVFKCFDIIGAEIGLSPWGSKFGYGRFEVVRPNDHSGATTKSGSSNS